MQLTLAEVKSLLGRSQSGVRILKTSGLLGEYNYAAYNDYESEDVDAYIEREIESAKMHLEFWRDSKKALQRLEKKGR